MYIESVPNRDSPPAILLRESYREAGKVRKRTLLNLSDWPHERIAGFKALLKGGTVIPKEQDAITITQQAMLTALLLGAPILLAGVLVGLLIGLAQALTQVQDQTVAFVPKIVAMVAVLVLCLPWLIQKMVEYSESLIANIPKTITGG